jgi:hypothetical protein
MPGRYTEELRRITRAQGGSTDEPTREGGNDSPKGRRGYRPLLAVLVVLTLVVAGWFVIRQLAADSKLQDCVMSGRKNCAPVEVDPAGR